MALSLRNIAHNLSNRGGDFRVDEARIPARRHPFRLESNPEHRIGRNSRVLD